MDVISGIINKAKELKRTIILPESMDERTIKAGRKLKDDGVLTPLFFGDPDKILKQASASGINIDDIKIYNPNAFEQMEDFVNTYLQLRAKENLTFDQARELFNKDLYFGAMMVRKGLADGMTAGAINTTGDVLKASIKIIGTASGVKTVSSYFIMIVPNCEYGDEGLFLFADCGVVPNPNAEQLADIAIATANTAKKLLGMNPKVAMLSFSTYGSGKDPIADKVIEATKIAKQKAPDLPLDGELQVDAAIVESVAKSKAPGSAIGGKANVLIFPDLNAGNIAYKIVQRLAKAEAYGPLIQGLAKPVNDLSRGCDADDIYQVAAITAVLSGS